MGNTFALPIIRLGQRLFIVLTLSCFAYVVFFLLSKNQDNPMPENSSVLAAKAADMLPPSPVFDLKPYDASTQPQARDIFSMTTVDGSSSTAESTPKGQLPDHLKVVGILIAHPSQIIIEDSSVNKTYFIDEANPQGGIKIVKVGPDQMVINYQGQNIPVPITKN